MSKGQIVVFTGDGKGKTSAALGVVLRASGHGMYVSVVQFVKGAQDTGEARAAERLTPQVEFVTAGSGFVNCCGDDKPREAHQKAAAGALALARQRIQSGSWDIVVLDEIITAVKLGLIHEREVLDLIALRPSKVNIILTGRDASPGIVGAADLVTEMRCIKHPYDTGTPARKGIDY